MIKASNILKYLLLDFLLLIRNIAVRGKCEADHRLFINKGIRMRGGLSAVQIALKITQCHALIAVHGAILLDRIDKAFDFRFLRVVIQLYFLRLGLRARTARLGSDGPV